jgi:hypothetical protein
VTAPLVVTALLDEETQERFDALRRAHFPPERNHLAAHLTLFHALPLDPSDDLAELAPACAARVVGVRSLGRGVAFDLEAPELVAVHRELRRRWAGRLTRQDEQGLRPHVTVQNKVAPAVARELCTELSAGFSAWTAHVTGLGLWRYLGGPWEAVASFPGR